MSDIEGKVAREAMSECGQRASFKTFGVASRLAGPSRRSFMRRRKLPTPPKPLRRLDYAEAGWHRRVKPLLLSIAIFLRRVD